MPSLRQIQAVHVGPLCGRPAKRNSQVISGAAWLALLCRPIPDRYEHLVRYVGRYSNRASGERAKNFPASPRRAAGAGK
jgi:hypothetical protein